MGIRKMLAGFLILAISTLLFSYEEPVKTLKEKQIKNEIRNKNKEAKIRIVRAYRYEIKDGKPTETILEKNEKEYDMEGRLAVMRKFTGKEIEKEWHYKYDQDSNMTEEVIRSGRLKILEKTNYKYDSQGRIISAETRDGSNKIIALYEYSYSEDKRIIKAKKYDGSKIILNTVEYLYPKNYDQDDCIETDVYDDGNNLIMKTVFSYDAKGNLSEKTSFGKDGKIKDTLFYSYDENNNLIKIKKESSSKALLGYEFRSYDKDGLLTEMKIVSGEEELTSLIKIEYKKEGK